MILYQIHVGGWNFLDERKMMVSKTVYRAEPTEAQIEAFKARCLGARAHDLVKITSVAIVALDVEHQSKNDENIARWKDLKLNGEYISDPDDRTKYLLDQIQRLKEDNEKMDNQLDQITENWT